MLREEMKKQICSVEFVISVLLLYMIFMLGSCTGVIPDKETSSILEAIINKIQNNWVSGASLDSIAVMNMRSIWTDNSYLPIVVPVILGLPFISGYIEEVTTQNKRLMLIRAGMKKYFMSKVMANIVTCICISALAMALYDITLLCFFETPKVNDVNGWYDVICQLLLGRSGSMNEIYGAIVKNNLYFIIYAIISGAFCFMVTVISRDRYVTLGATVLISYIQTRLYAELLSNADSKYAAIVADIIDPVYLSYAGKNGFYGDKEALALIVAAILTVVFYGAVYIYYKKQTDVSER